jgi:hypothetical protein
MKIHPFDKQMFYFTDERCLYSINQIKTLVRDGVAAPDEIVHLVEIQSFRAGDIAEGMTPRWAMAGASFIAANYGDEGDNKEDNHGKV